MTNTYNNNIISEYLLELVRDGFCDTPSKIYDEAFSGRSDLVTIEIPSSVTSIGYAAFSECSNLATITIPSSVTSIDAYAFSGCSSLTTIIIPSSVTRIGDNAFIGCSSLATVTIPSSVTSIGFCVFSGCSSLTTITIPSSVTSIGYNAFYGCVGLVAIAIPSSVTKIGNDAFRMCSGLKTISIPPSVTDTGSNSPYSFWGCDGLLKASRGFPSVIEWGRYNYVVTCRRVAVLACVDVARRKIINYAIPEVLIEIALHGCADEPAIINTIQEHFARDLFRHLFRGFIKEFGPAIDA